LERLVKERFEADDGVLLISALARHFDGGGIEVAKAISKAGDLIELSVGDVLISEASEDNDIYFIISGTVSVVVKGQQIRTLRPGDHVGEMAAIEPSLPRSASVIADSTLVAVKMTEGAFATIANTFPSIIWKSIAQELARRLNDRNRLMSSPNEKPRMFIISSVEGLEVARELQVGLQYDVLATVWTDGVFWAGGYPLEALEGAVSESDFGVAVVLPPFNRTPRRVDGHV
jgi:CRP/FNR family cyclic AMP-dependent transcriptional regulator